MPSVVIGELKYQKYRIALDSLNNATKNFSNLVDATSIRLPELPSPVALRQAIDQKMAEWVEELEATVEPTPFDAIDWKSVEQDSIWRRLPFEHIEGSEKGFRDRLVMETVVAFATRHINRSVVMLTKDPALTKAIEQYYQSPKNVEVLESAQALLNQIELLRLNLDKAFVDQVGHRIKRFFFDSTSNKGLVFEWRLFEKVLKSFAPQLESLPIDAGVSSFGFNYFWKAVTKEKMRVKETSFVERLSNHEYFWRTRIEMHRRFENTSKMLHSQLDQLKLRMAPFDVFWTVTIGADGQFSDAKLIEIRPQDATYATDLSFIPFDELTIEDDVPPPFLSELIMRKEPTTTLADLLADDSKQDGGLQDLLGGPPKSEAESREKS